MFLVIPNYSSLWTKKSLLSGTGDSRESFAIETPIFIAHQADSPESLEFPIRANHATKTETHYCFGNIFYMWPTCKIYIY